MEELYKTDPDSGIYAIEVQFINKLMHYNIGQEMGRDKSMEVVGIVMDENYYHVMGKIQYLVYAKNKSGDGEEKLWKRFIDLPVAITYDL